MSGSSSPETIDICDVMAEHFGASREAVHSMVHHGRVTIDGHTMKLKWMNHWTADQLYGRMLTCPVGSARLIGSRLMKDTEQLKLGV